MTPRLQASLGLLLALAIAGGWFVYTNSIPTPFTSGNATEKENSRILTEGASDTPDCSHDGTCEADTLYNEKEDASDEEKVKDTLYNEKEDASDEEKVKEDSIKNPEEVAQAKVDKAKEECVDNHESCDLWASTGECEANPKYMLRQCKKSCMVCGEIEIDLGVEQVIDSKRGDEVRARIDAAKKYVEERIARDPKQRYLLEGCKLNHENCAFWGVIGECEANPGYMKMQCAPVCETCEELSIDVRCPLDLEKMPNAWKPGDLNEMFTNLTTLEKYKHFEPNVLSRPDYLEGDTEETADYILGPWVVVLENVVTEEEAERLIELGGIEGYKRSSDVGKLKFDGSYESNVNDGRTSMNAWCQHECYNDTLAQNVIQRVTDITNIPEVNSENLQLLKYEVDQYYKTHHDYIPHLKTRQAGVRLLTVFLYLNDVEEGGGTDFPDLGITVQPKRGRALIWPSVLDEDPDEKDGRTMHQALPVKKGIKYGANAWVHQRDFKTPNNNGCG